MAKVYVRNRDLENALEIFHGFVAKEGIIKDYKKQQYYINKRERRGKRKALYHSKRK